MTAAERTVPPAPLSPALRPSSSPPDAPPAPVTVAQVAAELGVSRMTVYRLADRGELPALRVGRSVRFTRADVDAFLIDPANEYRTADK